MELRFLILNVQTIKLMFALRVTIDLLWIPLITLVKLMSAFVIMVILLLVQIARLTVQNNVPMEHVMIFIILPLELESAKKIPVPV
jgi:hypothetical protein